MDANLIDLNYYFHIKTEGGVVGERLVISPRRRAVFGMIYAKEIRWGGGCSVVEEIGNQKSHPGHRTVVPQILFKRIKKTGGGKID